MTQTSTYRYPGAKPFRTDEEHIFYGREADTQALLRQIELEPLIVLHGKSGLGKSSLINAGLIPKVAESGSFEPFSIRFGAAAEGQTAGFTPLERTVQVVGSQSGLLDKIRPAGDDSLWYHLKSRQLQQEVPRPLLLIFDQFEELFTYREEDVPELARQLAEALYIHVPQRYREERRRGFDRDPAFLSSEELERLDRPMELRVLLAIRSDRMSLLKELKAYLPNILTADYRLQSLVVEQAEDAILLPAYQKNGFATPVFDYDDEAIEHLLDYLSEGGKESIESFQLQILCEYVERELVAKQGRTRISRADLPDLDAILEEYYFNKITTIADPEERLAARRLIEEGLILEEEQRRLTLYEGQIRKTYGISADLLARLLDTHLIRSEPSLRGGYTYELSHDTLVAPVLKAKTRRLEEERLALEAQEAQAREAELADERRRRRRATFLAAVGFLLAAVSVAALIFAVNRNQRMNKALDEADESRRVANANWLRSLRADSARINLELTQLNSDIEVLLESEDTAYARYKQDQIDERNGSFEIIKLQIDSLRRELEGR